MLFGLSILAILAKILRTLMALSFCNNFASHCLVILQFIPQHKMTHFLIFHSFSQTWKLGKESFLAASRVEERLPFLITFFLVRFACGVPLILAWLLYDGCYLPSLFHYPVRCLADQHAWSYSKDRASSKELKQCCHKQHASLTELTHFLMGPASHSSK